MNRFCYCFQLLIALHEADETAFSAIVQRATDAWARNVDNDDDDDDSRKVENLEKFTCVADRERLSATTLVSQCEELFFFAV